MIVQWVTIILVGGKDIPLAYEKIKKVDKHLFLPNVRSTELIHKYQGASVVPGNTKNHDYQLPGVPIPSTWYLVRTV